jgi:hypothetical protein
MQSRYRVSKVGQKFLVVDQTGTSSKGQSRSSREFSSWAGVRAHFLSIGATEEALGICAEDLKKEDSAILPVDDNAS